MRRLLISLLLAGAAATPALADPGDHSDRDKVRAEHQQAREQSHADRPERSAPVQRPQFVPQGNANGAGQAHFNGAMNNGDQRQQFVRSERFQQTGGQPGVEQERVVERAPGPRVINNDERNWRGSRDRSFEGRTVQVNDDSLRQGDRPVPNVLRTRTRSPIVSDVPRPGTQPPLRVDRRRTGSVQWNTNWRHDGHHDWHDWRNRHHNRFHLGFYYDPFGWGYQPFSIGWRMWPNYYSSAFWINDPWQYRLPYAPPGTVWVRYYNDAVLVDTYTGEVVDVVYNFFW